jgi:hypothetical protein
MYVLTSPPETELIRARVVIQWLGVTERELRTLVELGIIRRIHFREHSKGYFLTSEIRQLLINQSVPPPDYTEGHRRQERQFSPL